MMDEWELDTGTGEVWCCDRRVCSTQIGGVYDTKNARIIHASPQLLSALKDSIGALEFCRDYHRDLGNEDQDFVQSKLDNALMAIAKAEGK